MVKLEVKVTGHPKPEGKWLKQGEEIVPSEEFQIENLEDGTSILIINDVYPDDTGIIKFEAVNSIGKAESITEFVVEEIIGTKDYRKPEWVAHMEEMQEALQAAYRMPFFITEPKNVRSLIGDKAKFKLTFSGYPPPAIIWYHNNRAMINGDRYRIVTKEQKSTLLIKSVTQDDFGYYVCKAMNDVGELTTRAKLIESSKAFMTPEEIEENRKKIEKRLAKKTKISRKASITEGKSLSSVNVEATVKSESKAAKKTSSESVDVAASFKTKPKQTKRKERREDVSSELTITKTENVFVQEVEETFITEVDHRTITMSVTDLKDINDLKSSDEVNDMLKKLQVKSFANSEGSLRELATIAYMIQKGLAVKQIDKLFQANLFPELQTPEAQCALVQLLERHGQASLVSEVLSEKTECDESYVATAGFRAFMKMIETKSMNVEEIILTISPDDFTASDWKQEPK